MACRRTVNMVWIGAVLLCIGVRGLSAACPEKCNCARFLVDCSFQGLTEIPNNIPETVQTLDLQGNQINSIKRVNFQGLRQIRELHLQDNAITSIEEHSFDALPNLTELLLNRNKLTDLPDKLFVNCKGMTRLDVSSNKLRHVKSYMLKGATSLSRLELENNSLECVARDALFDTPAISVLSLQRNRLSSLSPSLFMRARHLTLLRLANNRIRCDCAAQWLTRWLRANPSLAMFARCEGPARLRGQRLADVNIGGTLRCDAHGRDARDAEQGDSACTEKCPEGCACANEIGKPALVNCSGGDLMRVPEDMPKYSVNLVLQKNSLYEIEANAFDGLDDLKSLDLKNNKIRTLHSQSFAGLNSLTSLVLSGNKLKEVPEGVFRGLTSLKSLLLNNNEISCLPPGSFDELTELNLLSLFENKIMTMAKGMFTPLIHLQTLHLSENPLLCNCRLRWLGDYLRDNHVESSGAVCRYPERLAHRRVTTLYQTVVDGTCLYDDIDRSDALVWSRSLIARGGLLSDDGGSMVKMEEAYCGVACPPRCGCYGDTVNCTNAGLTLDELGTLPPHTKTLILKGNKVETIPSAFFADVPLLEKFDVTGNRIKSLPHGTFAHAAKLVNLVLSDNLISSLEPDSFEGLSHLQFLMLRSNRLRCLKNSTFSPMPRLRLLSVYGNRISCMQQEAFHGLRHLETLNLLGNPLSCDCHLRWFPEWVQLNTRASATVEGTCASPRPLVGERVQMVDPARLVCPRSYGEERVGCGGSQECCAETEGDSDRSWDSCHPQRRCPQGCRCEDTVLHCSRGNLSSLPVEDIDDDTTNLHLNGNFLEQIPTSINRFAHLISIDLTGNRLQEIAANQFANLTQLGILILNDNMIQCIHRSAFSGLKNLRTLAMHNNRIQSLPHGVFDGAPHINSLEISGNPLKCDCQAKWLGEWVRTDYREVGVARCAAPARMRNRVLSSTPSSRFLCLDEDEAELDSSAEPAHRCGSCSSVAVGARGGSTTPCHHGAECMDAGHGRFFCTCAKGTWGPLCKRKGAMPQGNPTAALTLQVTEGVVDSTKPPLARESSGCVGHRCQNGASCQPAQSRVLTAFQAPEYTCKCAWGWKGKYCEKLYTLAFSKRNAYVQLFNDRAPKRNATIKFRTTKTSGLLFYQGGRKAFVSVNITAGHVQVEIHAKGGYAEGVVADEAARTGKNSLGEGESEPRMSTVATGRRSVADNLPHTVTLLYMSDRIVARFDDAEEYTLGLAGGHSTNANITSYLKKKPASVGGVQARPRLVSTTSFQGCLLAVYSDQRLVDFEHANIVKFRATKPCRKEKLNACQSKPCENGGTCTATPASSPGLAGMLTGKRRKSGFQCKCRNGFFGQTCSQRGTCYAVPTKEIIEDTETGCRSKHPVKHKKCSGSCDGACCSPTKFRSKSVKFVCSATDRKYTKVVQLARKCSCRGCP